MQPQHSPENPHRGASRSGFSVGSEVSPMAEGLSKERNPGEWTGTTSNGGNVNFTQPMFTQLLIYTRHYLNKTGGVISCSSSQSTFSRMVTISHFLKRGWGSQVQVSLGNTGLKRVKQIYSLQDLSGPLICHYAPRHSMKWN